MSVTFYKIWALQPVVWKEEDGEEYLSVLWKRPLAKHFKKNCDRCLETTHEFVVGLGTSTGKDKSYEEFTIPKGWEFDGASIPKVFWSVIGKPTSSKFRLASMVHDWMYANKMGQKNSDELFRKILKKEGVWNFKANIMWAAVRTFGRVFYNKSSPDMAARLLKTK